MKKFLLFALMNTLALVACGPVATSDSVAEQHKRKKASCVLFYELKQHYEEFFQHCPSNKEARDAKYAMKKQKQIFEKDTKAYWKLRLKSAGRPS